MRARRRGVGSAEAAAGREHTPAAQPGSGVPLLVATAAVAATAYLVLALLPMLTARHGVRG
jgi:hypothetical protein